MNEPNVSYREWLVAHVAAGLLANPNTSAKGYDDGDVPRLLGETLAKVSIAVADEIIKALDS